MSGKLLDKFMDGGDVSSFYSKGNSMINMSSDNSTMDSCAAESFDGGKRRRKRAMRKQRRKCRKGKGGKTRYRV